MTRPDASQRQPSEKADWQHESIATVPWAPQTENREDGIFDWDELFSEQLAPFQGQNRLNYEQSNFWPSADKGPEAASLVPVEPLGGGLLNAVPMPVYDPSAGTTDLDWADPVAPGHGSLLGDPNYFVGALSQEAVNPYNSTLAALPQLFPLPPGGTTVYVPISEELRDLPLGSGALFPSTPGFLDNFDLDSTCLYFDEPVQHHNGLGHGTQALVPIAPKPTTAQADISTSTPSHIVREDTSGSSSSSVPSKRKRKPLSEEGRKKAKRCNEELPCGNCLKVKDSRKVYRGPCVRLNMNSIQTFRIGDGDNGHVRAELPNLHWPKSVNIKIVKLQWPFRTSMANTPILTIDCEQFQPVKENLVEEYVVNGIVRRVVLPPWACRDTKSAQENTKRFMAQCQNLLEDEIRETLDDPIMILTWNEVLRYRVTYNTPLITRALQIYAGDMMNSRYPTTVEANVFGVADEEHTPYFFEKLPLPAQLILQIQTMIGFVMVDIQADILKELKKRIYAQDRLKHWYEIFLTIFILLASIEWVYQIQMRFVKAKTGVSDRNHTNISYVTQYMLEEWESSALNLIGHFRCVMNGEIPFAQSWDDDAENPQRTQLDVEAIAFIRNIKRETEERREELRELCARQKTNRFEKPLAAICELFLPRLEEKE
ncbi:hypothetical protein N0V90_009428 [Kalmusia sp. IMI 367209]|nr:hypothetical protein N0V90_009428 [Kalmusia sp. IMI 367209]